MTKKTIGDSSLAGTSRSRVSLTENTTSALKQLSGALQGSSSKVVLDDEYMAKAVRLRAKFSNVVHQDIDDATQVATTTNHRT
jgi:hypothetical protein